MSKKVLFVSPVGAFFSGAEVAIANLMAHLVDKGYHVYNVIPDNGADRDDTYIQFMEEKGIQLYQLETKEWWWQEAQEHEDSEQLDVLAYQQKNIFQIQKIIQEAQIDLVISNTVNVFQGALAAVLEQIPHYYIIHEFPFGEFGYYEEKIDFINKVSDKIFVVSGDLHKILMNYFPSEKLCPFFPYSHLDVIELRPSDKHRLVSVGGINERKNQLELIQAFEKIKDKNLELVFIGGWDTDYKKTLDDYISTHQISDVRFLGYVSQPFSYLTDKDLVVFTSKMEAFPLVYVESVLAGVPTLVSETLGHHTVSDYFEVNRSYALGNIGELAEKIETYIDEFETIYAEAQTQKQHARALYNLEQLSSVFIDELSHGTHLTETKDILALKSMIGWDIDENTLSHISEQCITIYHSHDVPYYKVSRYTLHDKGEIEIDVEQANYIRIDLKRYPAVYTNITMLDKTTGEKIQPVHTTALSQGDRLVFWNDDSQIVYDTSNLKGHILYFSYQLESVFAFGKSYKTLYDEVSDKQRRLMQIEADYAKLSHEYHSVLTSRRWRIPTKIINLFRRK